MELEPGHWVPLVTRASGHMSHSVDTPHINNTRLSHCDGLKKPNKETTHSVKEIVINTKINIQKVPFKIFAHNGA